MTMESRDPRSEVLISRLAQRLDEILPAEGPVRFPEMGAGLRATIRQEVLPLVAAGFAKAMENGASWPDSTMTDLMRMIAGTTGMCAAHTPDSCSLHLLYLCTQAVTNEPPPAAAEQMFDAANLRANLPRAIVDFAIHGNLPLLQLPWYYYDDKALISNQFAIEGFSPGAVTTEPVCEVHTGLKHEERALEPGRLIFWSTGVDAGPGYDIWFNLTYDVRGDDFLHTPGLIAHRTNRPYSNELVNTAALALHGVPMLFLEHEGLLTIGENRDGSIEVFGGLGGPVPVIKSEASKIIVAHENDLKRIAKCTDAEFDEWLTYIQRWNQGWVVPITEPGHMRITYERDILAPRYVYDRDTPAPRHEPFMAFRIGPGPLPDIGGLRDDPEPEDSCRPS